MHRFTLLLFLLSFANGLSAQLICDDLSEDVYLTTPNRIQAVVHDTRGPFGFSDAAPALSYQPEGAAAAISTVFSSAFWVGGFDPGGNLQLSATTYSNSVGGALGTAISTQDAACSLYDTLWVVPGADIEQHLQELSSGGAPAVQRSALYGYPARNNPHFNQFNPFSLPPDTDLAPFFDADNDGNYDPAAGDFPLPTDVSSAAIPAELAWSVRPSSVLPDLSTLLTGVIQQTVFTYACTDEPLLEATIFAQQKFINTGVEDLDTLYLGMWNDFDLGCYTDDYVGTAPGLNTVYAYNQNIDDAMNCESRFDGAVPVAAMTLLNRPMTSANVMLNGSVFDGPPARTDPQTPIEYYHYLSGSWRDGSSITNGDTGYAGDSTVQFIFPDNPNDPDGWSLNSINLTDQDRRTIASSYVGYLGPGESVRLDVAYSVHEEAGGDHLSHVDLMYAQVPELQAHYDAGFADIACANVLNSTNKLPALTGVEVYPNPARTAVTVRTADVIDELRVYDVRGREWLRDRPGRTEVRLSTEGLPAGVLLLKVRSGARWTTQKLVVLK